MAAACNLYLNLCIERIVFKNFSISVGVAESKMEYAHGKDVFLQADAQLYRAKQNGRNQVCYE